jgi:hypothetical protein
MSKYFDLRIRQSPFHTIWIIAQVIVFLLPAVVDGVILSLILWGRVYEFRSEGGDGCVREMGFVESNKIILEVSVKYQTAHIWVTYGGNVGYYMRIRCTSII